MVLHEILLLCEEIASRQEKLLVFTQFREMTAPLASFLAQQFGKPGLVLHGGTAVKQRQKLVEQSRYNITHLKLAIENLHLPK